MEMPGWGPAWGRFRWIPGTDVATLLLLRISGVDHSWLLCSLSPFLLRPNSFVRPPRKPASLPAVAPLFSSPLLPPPCPTVCRSFLRPPPPPPAQAAQTQSGVPAGPLDVAALPQPGCLLRQLKLQSAQQAPGRARALATGVHPGVHLRAQLEATSVGETAWAQFRVDAPAEKHKSKTNTQQMKPACSRGSPCTPPEDQAGYLLANFLGSQTEGLRVDGAGEETLEEFVSNVPSSLVSF